MAELRTMARPYARAAFACANEHNELPLWRDGLSALARIAEEPGLRSALHGPRRLSERVCEDALEALGEQRANERVRNFLRMLAARRRLALLSEISRLFDGYAIEADGRVRVEVTSARALDAAERGRVEDALGKRLGRKVQASYEEDGAMLAGLLVRVGDRIIDGTLKSRLERLSAALNT